MGDEERVESTEVKETQIDEVKATEGTPEVKVPDKKEEDQQRRILELERDAAYYRGVAEATKTKPEVIETPVVDQPLRPPKMDDYPTYEAYEEAKEEYLLARAEKRAEKRIMDRLETTNQQQESVKIEGVFKQRIDEAAKTDPDIYKLLKDETLQISVPMAVVIKKSELAPQLLRYLDQNREIAADIARMEPLDAANRIGEITAELKIKAKAPPVKIVSQAPEPIETVKSKGSTEVDEDNLPMDEWVKRRNKKQFGEKRR